MVDRKSPIIGGDLFASRDLQTSLNVCRDAGMDFAVLPLVHPRAERNKNSSLQRAAQFAWPLTRSDTLLTSQQWSSLFVARLSKWLRFDNVDLETRIKSEHALREEFSWSSHLGLFAVISPEFTSDSGVLCYAQQMNSMMLQFPTVMVWQEVQFDDWKRWNVLRNACDTSSSLKVILKITPQDEEKEEHLQRWFGEPVKAINLPCSLFVLNQAGFPTLPPSLRRLVCGFHERKVCIVLSGRPQHVDGLRPYKMYLDHLCSKQCTKISPQEEFESPFYDYLQVPLQPLGDNLESQTYETFEKDPVKYAQYELAICNALQGKNEACIMVVGAGRGPLVRAALSGAKRAGCAKVKVFAVEKNPNAVNTLLNLFADQRAEVEVVAQDMRDWNTDEHSADLIVSELLGSWGDNELSPECLQALCPKYLKPETGLSIPAQYTSYVAPLASHRIWSDIRNLARGPLDLDASQPHGVTRFETPYVVRLFNVYHVAEPQPCFTFEHKWNSTSDLDTLERVTALWFTAKLDSMVHGFAGYFSSELFPGVHISILPSTFSTGMFSWFPLFLPLREPVFVKRGEEIRCTFWRRISKTKVWYEWHLETDHVSTAVHNPNGRSYAVNL